MDEEIRKPGAELNDAKLEGVSGGYDPGQRALEIARDTCAQCKQDSLIYCKGGSPELLARAVIKKEANMRLGYFSHYFCPYGTGIAPH